MPVRTRSNYNYAPAQGEVVRARPAPRRAQPRMQNDRLLLLLFFAVIPITWLASLMWDPIRWLLVLIIICTVSLLWLQHGFTARGRLSMTLLSSLLLVWTLSSALGGDTGNLPRTNTATVPPITNFGATTQQQGIDPLLTPLESQQQIDPAQQLTMPDVGTVGFDVQQVQAQAQANQNRPLSLSEQVLEQFLEGWKRGIFADLLPLCAPSFRASLDQPPETWLFYNFGERKLITWDTEGPPSGTDGDTSRTITVIVELQAANGNLRTYRYDTLMLLEGTTWYVDPRTLTGAAGAVLSTPAPNTAGGEGGAPVITPTPSPKPTPTPNKKTKLYYNKSGGKYYHSDPNCASLADKYKPLKSSFTYADINKSPNDKLLRCDTCDAPSR